MAWAGKKLVFTALVALCSHCKPAGEHVRSATPQAATPNTASNQPSTNMATGIGPSEASLMSTTALAPTPGLASKVITQNDVVQDLKSTSQAPADKPDSSTAPCVIRIMDIPRDDVRYTYYDQLLRLAIAKTEVAQRPCRIETTEFVSHLRKLRMMQTGQLDVAGNVNSAEWEQGLLAIPVPVHQGLHGIRLLVIRKGDEARFATIRNLHDLQQLRAGVMRDWQVREVLEANAIPVQLTDHYDSLYAMLARQRFDYIPLSLFEVQQEMTRHSPATLAVEPTLVLNYPSVDYFFVRPERKDLFARIQRGLELAIKDGSRDELFNRFSNFPTILQQAALPGRTVIVLRNPSQAQSNPALEKQLLNLDELMRRSPH